MLSRDRHRDRGFTHGDIAHPMLDRNMDQGPSFAGFNRHFGDFLLHQLGIRLVFEMSDARLALRMISGGSQKQNHGPGAWIPDLRQQLAGVERLAPHGHPPVNRSGPHNIDCMDTGSRHGG